MPRERIVTHTGFDRLDVSNFTLHEIDPVRMVELRRTCVDLDSPNVQLKQVRSSFLFLASAAYTPKACFGLTETFALSRSDDGPPLSTEPLGPLSHDNIDPTMEFGDLPGLFPISAAVRSRDNRYVYYSANSDNDDMRFRRVVRFDTKAAKITAETVLNPVGCKDERGLPSGRVHYLFMDERGRLIAFAGSDVHHMDHDHYHE